LAFIFGGILPVLATLIVPLTQMVLLQYIIALTFLVILGTVAAKAGGSSVQRAILRVVFWGTAAMGVTAYIGHVFGVNI